MFIPCTHGGQIEGVWYILVMKVSPGGFGCNWVHLCKWSNGCEQVTRMQVSKGAKEGTRVQVCTRAQISTRMQADTRCKWYCILIPLHSWMDGWEDRGWLVCYNSKEGPLMHMCLLSPAFTPVPTHAPVCTQTLVSAHAHLQYCVHLHPCICSSPCACWHPCIHLCLLAASHLLVPLYSFVPLHPLIPVADPGFPWGGGTNSPWGGANIWFCHIFLKTAWNWKNLGPRGGARPSRPLRSATAYSLLATGESFTT